jgi:hypothetical protein
VRSTSVDDQLRDSASLVPEWPTTMEARSSGFKNDHLASGRPSIVRRMSRALARFSIAVQIGVCATLAWQSYGDEAREMLSTRVPSLRWLSVTTTTSTSGGLGSAQDPTLPQSALVSQRSASAAATTSPELAQLEPMARDLAAMRRSLEQLAAKQEQIAQTVTTLPAVEQDIKQKMSSPALSQAVPIPPRKPPRPSAPSSSVQSPPAPTPPPLARSP